MVLRAQSGAQPLGAPPQDGGAKSFAELWTLVPSDLHRYTGQASKRDLLVNAAWSGCRPRSSTGRGLSTTTTGGPDDRVGPPRGCLHGDGTMTYGCPGPVVP